MGMSEPEPCSQDSLSSTLLWRDQGRCWPPGVPPSPLGTEQIPPAQPVVLTANHSRTPGSLQKPSEHLLWHQLGCPLKGPQGAGIQQARRQEPPPGAPHRPEEHPTHPVPQLLRAQATDPLCPVPTFAVLTCSLSPLWLDVAQNTWKRTPRTACHLARRRLRPPGSRIFTHTFVHSFFPLLGLLFSALAMCCGSGPWLHPLRAPHKCPVPVALAVQSAGSGGD